MSRGERQSLDISQEDPWYDLFDELKDRTNKMKGRLYRLKKVDAEERTFEERETLMGRWLELVEFENQINELLDEYQEGPTKHSKINLQVRYHRQEAFENFKERLLNELHKDFTYVS